MTAGGAPEISDAKILTELRTQLAQDFPVFDVAEVRRILRGHGLTAPPAGFLLDEVPSNRTAHSVRHSGDHPLFSPGFYLAAYADVAAAEAPAWLHYQVFGRVEGRTPHPFIDVAWIRGSLPDAMPGTEVDRYLADRAAWFTEPGPYTEAARFALSGMWSGEEAPVAEIVRSHANGPWVHRRLMLIDLAGEAATARLAAFSSVLGAAPVGVRTPMLAAWSDPAPAAPGGPYVAVPGFFLGAHERRIWSTAEVAVSPDGTAVSTLNEVVTVAAGPQVVGGSLQFFTAPASRAELSSAVYDAAPHTVLAPATRAGEVSLRQLRRELGRSDIQVLAYGRQATVDADSVELRYPAPLATPPAAPSDLVTDALRTAIVLPLESRLRVNTDSRIRAALAAGAALCLVDGHGLNSWLPVIQNRARVVVAEPLVEAVGAFVGDERITALDGAGR